MTDRGLPKLLREASAASGRSRYRVAKDAELSQIVLDRFLNGERDVTLATADKLIESLGRHLLWVRHLAEMADRSPWFAVDCAWTAVENSTVVAIQHAQRYLRRRSSCGTVGERLEFLSRKQCISDTDADAIRELEIEAKAAELNQQKLTSRQARKFVARAAVLVETLWSI